MEWIKSQLAVTVLRWSHTFRYVMFVFFCYDTVFGAIIGVLAPLDLRGRLPSCPKKLLNARMCECWNRYANSLKLHEKQKRSQFSHLMKLLWFQKRAKLKACILNDLYQHSNLEKSKTSSKTKLFLPWRCPKMLPGHSVHNDFIAMGAPSTEHPVLRWTVAFGRVTEAGLYSRRVSRHTRGVQRRPSNSLVLATAADLLSVRGKPSMNWKAT